MGNLVTAKPFVAIDDGGLAIEAWSETSAGKAGVRVAQHAPGGAWTTFPGTLSGSLPGDGCSPFASIDPAGNALVVWSQWAGPGCGSGNQTMLFATRAAGAAAWSAPGVVGASAPQGDWSATAAANAAGQIVVAWETASPTNKFVFGAVGSPTTGFGVPTMLTTSPLADSLYYLAAAIGPSGDAAVQWNDNTGSTSNVLISLRPRGGTFQATATPITNVSSPSSASGGSIALDAAGDVLSAYSFYDGTTATFASRVRPASNGTWQPPQTIATPQTGYSGSWVAVGLDGAGNATAAWVESNFSIPIPHPRRVFTATRPGSVAGAWVGQAPVTDVLPSLDNTVQIAVSPSGAAAISWGIDAPAPSAQALYRPAGGAFGALMPIGAGTANGAAAGVSLAPSGDAAISFIGADNDARVSVLDTTPPTITSVTVPASATTGQAVAMSTQTSDTWSPLGTGQPSWNFGDGTTGAGVSVTHAYAKAGTYTVTLSASDAVANAAAPVSRQIAVTTAAGPPPPVTPATSVNKPKLKAAYIASKLIGSLVLTGTSGAKVTLTIAIRKHGAKKNSSSSRFAANVGKWTRTLKLPTGLTPGKYDVTISGNGVTSSQTSFAIAAPKAGIVKRSYASGPRRGPAATRLGQTSELWAHFIFGTLPKKGQTITTQWVLPNGTKLAANTRPRTSLVEAQVKDLSGKALPIGRWRCVIRAGGSVVATLNVRLK
jgi:hypothetical protein